MSIPTRNIKLCRFSSKKQILNIKLFSLFFVILLLFSFRPSLISGQTALEKAQQDYAFQFTKYRDAQEKYQSAKASYESFKTATAKNEAFVKTKEYLIAVDSMYITYLALVKESANQVDWSNNPQAHEKTQKLASDEITFIVNNQQEVQKAQNLEELPPVAKKLDSHLTRTTRGKIYYVLATYKTVASGSLWSDFLRLSSKLTGLVDQKHPQGVSSVVANWQSEVDGIKQQASSELEKIQMLMSQYGEDSISAGEFNNIDSKTKQVKQILQRSESLLSEILSFL